MGRPLKIETRSPYDLVLAALSKRGYRRTHAVDRTELRSPKEGRQSRPLTAAAHKVYVDQTGAVEIRRDGTNFTSPLPPTAMKLLLREGADAS